MGAEPQAVPRTAGSRGRHGRGRWWSGWVAVTNGPVDCNLVVEVARNSAELVAKGQDMRRHSVTYCSSNTAVLLFNCCSSTAHTLIPSCSSRTSRPSLAVFVLSRDSSACSSLASCSISCCVLWICQAQHGTTQQHGTPHVSGLSSSALGAGEHRNDRHLSSLHTQGQCQYVNVYVRFREWSGRAAGSCGDDPEQAPPPCNPAAPAARGR